MTTGQLLFYSGAGLFVLTVIFAVVFIIKKPKYCPENATGGNMQTVPLRNGYPTESMTVRYGKNERIVNGGQKATEKLPETVGTVLLKEGTVPLSGGTQLLPPETEWLMPDNER